MANLYILFSEKLNKYYVGACTDLDIRMYEHNIGHSKFTSTGIPWALVYQETFDDLTTAKQRELHIKKNEITEVHRRINMLKPVEHPDFIGRVLVHDSYRDEPQRDHKKAVQSGCFSYF